MILSGQPVAEKIYQEIQADMTKLSVKPMLAIVLVGENPASLSFIKIKQKIADRLGISYKLYQFQEMAPSVEIEKLIDELNQNNFATGIVVQLPLPEKIETEKIINLVSYEKDIDGFRGAFPAPTAQAILDILNFYSINLKEKKIVIVGYGRLVGRPLDQLLKKQNIIATICDSRTVDLKEKTLSADILISATGVPGLIQPDMVRSKTIVIDAGTAEADGKMVGDVAPVVYEKVESYTPTPGGVGPVTVAELFKNLVEAATE